MAGCSSCSTTTGSSGGCQNNGTCGTSDCNKMNAFDWLSHMGIPVVDKYNVVEVKFKGGRKEYYRNVDHLHLTTGDPIVVDVPNGHHIGWVSLQGELVRLQMQKRKIKDDDSILRIYRVANQKDIEKWEESKNREVPTIYRTKQIIDELKLDMKLSDVEFQADNSKATFFYSAEDRVDFRELIKLLASEFKIRVEMRQISLRQEAGRLGGIGVCGRELCCSTWIHDFKSVSTSAARYQNLSLNPTKLSGQCGRLKCCLNYELDTYMSALEDIPVVEKPLFTEAGPAKLQKTDIFRKLMWFSYNNENNWHSITCERVKEIQLMNAKDIKPFDLQNDHSKDAEDKISRSNMELEALDKKFSTTTTRKKKKKKKPRARTEGDLAQGTADATPRPVRTNSQNSKNPSSTVEPKEGNRDRNRFKKNRLGRKNVDQSNQGEKKPEANQNSNTPKPRANPKPKVEGNAENKVKESKNGGKRRFHQEAKETKTKGIKMHKLGSIFAIPIMLIVLFSCNADRVFEEYKGMETQTWIVSDTVTFELPKTNDPISPIIGVKYNMDYKFRNLYIKYFLSDSLGNKFESQLLNISLFDSKEGRPTGSGFGSSYTRFDTLPLKTKSTYSKVEFVQYMRVEELAGIEAIGFKQVKKTGNLTAD